MFKNEILRTFSNIGNNSGLQIYNPQIRNVEIIRRNNLTANGKLQAIKLEMEFILKRMPYINLSLT